MAYQTPGVYVEEITTLAPSVVAVETAIPVFIGYTERASDAKGGDLKFVPTRIKSQLEFQNAFGGEFVPAAYRVVLNIQPPPAPPPPAVTVSVTVNAVSPRAVGDTERRYYLATSVRHYYANGGGPCYIVSVGSYSDAPALGAAATPAGLLGGLARIEPVDDPTLLVFPDGVSLSVAELGSLQAAALAQCEKLQDRFVVMDLRDGDQPATLASDPIAKFRDNVGTGSLKYGAAYYPWVRTIYRPLVQFRQLTLVDTALAAIPQNTIDVLPVIGGPVDPLIKAVREADARVADVVAAVNIAGMAGPNPLTLTRANFARLADHFKTLLDLLRQTSPTLTTPAANAIVRQRFANLLVLPRAMVLALRTLQQAAEPAAPAVSSMPAWLILAIVALYKDAALVANITALVGYEKNPSVMSSIAATRAVADVQADYAALNDSPWILPNANVTAITPNIEDFTGPSLRAVALNSASALRAMFEPIAAAVLALFTSAESLGSDAEKQLFAGHPVFADILEQVTRTMVLLPPSGAVVGIYSAVDRTRGVWKAPANVSLADISGVAVKINDQLQQDMNVTSTGKSVNVIRTFAGKGSLIWGARTLAGNDNEWRYVPVRRFFNMAEESIKKATEAFVFEPNDRNTWVRVRAMIENFLTVQWRQGALAGAVPQQAFFVKVGLGETMTSQDILEGRMIVEIGMAVVRPAEFIVLRFAHKMQTS